jgi:hypothetical protein
MGYEHSAKIFCSSHGDGEWLPPDLSALGFARGRQIDFDSKLMRVGPGYRGDTRRSIDRITHFMLLCHDQLQDGLNGLCF